MTQSARVPKILLIDSNVYFSKRLSDALKKEGFQVLASTQPEFALTTLEYDTPTAVVCATNMRGMGALEIATIIHADPKNSSLPIIALGDGSQRALMEAFQAGCDDYIDRQRQPAVIAAHIRNIIISKAEGFQPTQMLAQADTSLSGSLTHHDLPGVLQMLGHAHQTGALHINAGATDAVLFFDAGNITHAECGSLFGDEAVIHIVKSCIQGGEGVYKFVYGATTPRHTVLRSATDLMLDAMREYDESANSPADTASAQTNAVLDDILGVNQEDPSTPNLAPEDRSTPEFNNEDRPALELNNEDQHLGTAPSTSEAAAFPEPNQDPSVDLDQTNISEFVSQPDQDSSNSIAPSENLESSPELSESPSTPDFTETDQGAPGSQFEPGSFLHPDSTLSASDSAESADAPTDSVDDSVPGYTETLTSPDRESTGTELILAAEAAEEISLLEKILMELAARNIVEETPADNLADKEAQ